MLGNLADLGLGDIFQIVSLSRRSGMLQLTTPNESGEIVFASGRVVAVYTTSETRTVGDGLLDLGLVSPTLYQDMLAAQAQSGSGVELFARFGILDDRLHDALEELVKRAIYAMFDWEEGTFSFVLEDIRDPWRGFALDGTRLVSERGLNPQYLAIEGARLRDERAKEDSLETFLAIDKPAQTTLQSPRSAGAKSFAARLRSANNDANTVHRATPDAGPAAAPEPAPQPIPQPTPAPEQQPTPASGHGPEGNGAQKVIPFPSERLRRGDVPPPAPIVEAPPAAVPAIEAEAGAGAAASSYRLLAIDDDPQVTKALLNEFSGRLASVSTANTVADALPEIERSPPGLVVASDLIIARSDGAGILGGIEVLEKVRDRQPDVPVILFSDYENAEAEERANRLGVAAFLMKPRKAQIQAGRDADGTSPAMREFLLSLGTALAPFLGGVDANAATPAESPVVRPGDVRGAAPGDEALAAEPPAPGATQPSVSEPQNDTSTGWDSIPGRAESVEASGLYDLRTEMAGDLDAIDVPGAADLPAATPPRESVGMLRSMLAELLDPANRDTVTLLVLRFASQIFERAALFLVTRRAYVGLGGFSATESSDKFVARVRRVHVSIDVESVLSTVAKYRSTYRGPLNQADGNRQLIDGFGGPWPSSHVAALPLISNDRVAAILYGDNTEETALAATDTLEIFLQQAGLAMDRALLERRLEERRRPDDD